MDTIITGLKSLGRLGSIGLILLGIGSMAFTFFKGIGNYQSGLVLLSAGVAGLGMRNALGRIGADKSGK